MARSGLRYTWPGMGAPRKGGVDPARVLHALRDVVVVADGAGKISYVNDAVQALLGYRPEELIGETLDKIIPERLKGAHNSAFDRYAATGESRLSGRTVRAPALCKDGSETEIEISIASFLDDDDVRVVAASLRDLSGRVELERRLALSQSLHEATLGAARLPGLTRAEDIFRITFETIHDAFEAELVRIWDIDPESGKLRLVEGHGVDAPADQGSFAERALETLEPIVEYQLDQAPGWASKLGFRSAAALPVLVGGKPTCIVEVFERTRLTEELIDALAGFLAVVAASLASAELARDAQQALDRAEGAEHRWHELVEGLDAIVWEGSAETFEFSYVNQKAEEVLGYPVESWLTEKDFWVKTLHPDDRDWALEFCIAATAENRSHDFEYRAITKDRRVVWLRDIVQVVPGADGKKKVRGVMVDISARKRAEEALVDQQARYRQLFDASPLPVIVFDEEELKILAASEAAVKSYGYARSELIRMPITELEAGDDEDGFATWTSQPGDAGGISGPYHAHHVRKDGSRIGRSK